MRLARSWPIRIVSGDNSGSLAARLCLSELREAQSTCQPSRASADNQHVRIEFFAGEIQRLDFSKAFGGDCLPIHMLTFPCDARNLR